MKAVTLFIILLLPGAVIALPEKPNFIFLLVDDLGWTDLGCFGSDLYETPNLDKLCAAGMKFTDGYAACTVCSPTRAAVMTGKYPHRTGITNWISGPSMRLKHQEVTIAEVLQADDYFTLHAGKWHLAPRGAKEVADYYPEDQGFDVNIGGTHWGAPGSYFHPYSTAKRKMERMPEGGKEGDYLTDHLTEAALNTLGEHRDERFFFSFWYYNVHTPIQGKPKLVEHYQERIKPGMRHRNASYAAMLHSVDDSVGRIVAFLREHDLEKNTVIIFTGDNGGLRKVTDNHPLRAGKGSAYEGGVREPTFIVAPGLAEPGSSCSEPVISVDYYPTMLELAGLPGDPAHNEKVDGMSLVSLLKNPAAKLKRDTIFWHYPHRHGGGARPYGALRERDWKLVEHYHPRQVELFNLAEDIGEQNNLAPSMPEKAGELSEKLHAWLKETGAKIPGPKPGRLKKKTL